MPRAIRHGLPPYEGLDSDTENDSLPSNANSDTAKAGTTPSGTGGGADNASTPPTVFSRFFYGAAVALLALVGSSAFAVGVLNLGGGELNSSLFHNQTTCEKNTGGTCFTQPCSSWRLSTCTPGTLLTIQVAESNDSAAIHLPPLWKYCRCQGDMCAGTDGRCYQDTFPKTTSSELRADLSWLFILLVVVMGRSGLFTLLCDLLGVTRLCRASRPLKTHYQWEGPWDRLKHEQELTKLQVFSISVLKLFGWHIGQIVWFIFAYHAYAPYMHRVQYIFAVLLIMKEMLYFAIILAGLIHGPHFLLFCPLSECSLRKRMIYFLSPDIFISITVQESIRGSGVAACRICNRIIGLVSAFLSLAASTALFAGLFRDGVMFPSLCFAYLSSGLSLVGVFAGQAVIRCQRIDEKSAAMRRGRLKSLRRQVDRAYAEGYDALDADTLVTDALDVLKDTLATLEDVEAAITRAEEACSELPKGDLSPLEGLHPSLAKADFLEDILSNQSPVGTMDDLPTL